MGLDLTPQGTTLLTEIGGAGTGLASAFLQGEAQKAQSEFEERSLRTQAKLVSAETARARRRGDIAGSQAQQRTKKLLGAQRAALAAQGIDIESGSALALQQETETLGALDEATIRRNARLQALSGELEVDRLLTQARITRIGGRIRRRGTITTGGLRFAREVAGAAREFSDDPVFLKR